MFGPRISTVFRNRWNALLWGAGIMMTSYCAIPSDSEDAGSNAIVQAAVAKYKSPESAKKANPWAKDAPAEQQ